MAFRIVTTFVLTVALAGQGSLAAAQQTYPARPPQDRPTPLPRPVPDRPQIQPPRPNPGPNPGYDNRGYAGRIRCESRGDRSKRCDARTENRVVLLDRHGGSCTQGRSWGYDRRSIWVSRGCRATFAYGYGNDWGNGRPDPGRPEKDKDKGPSTGLIVGGVVVAAGLVALLATRNKDKKAEGGTATPPATETETPATFPAGPPASVSADLSVLPEASRPSMQSCLFEAARQIGATGGTRLRFDKLVNIEPGNGGWRFRTEMTATYPDGDRALPMYCRATPSKVVQLDFAS